MKALTAISGIVTFLVTMPIWYYLLYKVLEGVNASQLMWFLFWVYLPVNILMGILARIAAGANK